MTLNADDEILQDFLVEASEIVELLGEQLVDLEQRPDDSDLLNAIFRGFHTVKGGAGFLAITPLVDTCHRAEDVFNVLRQGQRQVTADLMDAVLQALDVVNEQMDMIRDGEMPEPPDAVLLQTLEMLAEPDDGSGDDAMAEAVETAPEAASPEPVEEAVATEAAAPDTDAVAAEAPVVPGGEDITEEEFETLLDQLHGKGKHGGVPADAAEATSPAAEKASEDITDEEFEALLDELHGKGQHGGTPSAPAEEAPSGKAKSAEEITEDEFESLLDELHGKGKHGGVPGVAAGEADAPAVQAVAAAKPAPQPAPKAVKKPASKPAEKQAAKPAAATKSPEPAKAAEGGRGAGGKVAQAETTVRVDTQRLDDIMNMVGELVLVRNRLSTLKSTMADEELANAVGNLDVVTADLQLSVMKTRMQPVKKIFGRFPRVVRDLARNLKREVDLVLNGEETDL
ncbi:MAG: Hpt domain-containing protein, partial [Gammaproteobacteria bacterium]|nr:Hpt domain-containing protein [Gammaproteobacteria bacterium]